MHVAEAGLNDEEVLERMQRKGSDDGEDSDDDMVEDDDAQEGENAQAVEDEGMADEAAPAAGFDLSSLQTPVVERNTVVTRSTRSSAGDDTLVSERTKKETVMLSSTLKRKEDRGLAAEPPAKRIDTGKAPEVFGGGGKMDVDAGGDEDSDSDSDGSVHLHAALEGDSDED